MNDLEKALFELRLDVQQAIIGALLTRRIDDRKLMALLLSTEDRTQAQIADVFRVSQSTVSRWIAEASEDLSSMMDGYA